MFKFTDRIFLRLPVLPAKKNFSLNEIMHDAFFMEGIQIASPVLFDEACRFKDDNKNSEPNKKLARSLLKYFQRASYRCTPFGLFSACAIANWIEQGNGIICTNHSRSTRLDMHFSVALQQHLASLPQIKSELYFFRNTSVSILLDKLRFTEYFYKNNQRKHVLSEVDYSVYLEKILQRANDGATIHELVQHIVSDEIDSESAKQFIDELVLNQVLVSELEASVSGDELLADLIVKLKRVYSRKPGNKSLLSEINQLELILRAIYSLDSNLVNEKSTYDKVILLLKNYPIELDNSKLFQVDTFIHNSEKDNVVGLPVSAQKNLIEAIHFLGRINGRSTNSNLQNFISEFTKKYETRAVPLLEVMDNEFGLGYGSTLKRTNNVNELTEGIITAAMSDEITIKQNEIHQFLESKLLEAVTNNSYTVSFDKNSLKSMDDRKANFPDSMAVHFSVLNKDFSSFNILLRGTWGPSSTSVLGRFASGSDQINHLVREIVSHEEKLNENKILAEIVHLPENRTGNVLLRPSFRKFEIPYLASSSLAKEYLLELSDLYLQMQNSRLVLWSKKHGKEVLPRLSNAHNYSYNALPIYHFLCDLQAQDVQPGMSFSWGNIQNRLKFIPAAVFEKVILVPATWQFNRDDIQEIISWKAPDQLEKLFEWKKKWNIPDRFYLSEGDNDLLIYLVSDQSLMIDLFLSEISTRKNIILKEFLFDLKNPFVVSSDESGYTNEFIAPILRQDPFSKPVSEPIFNELKRTFIPGSEWIYYKVYCGEKTAERILLELFYPLSTEICDTLKLAEKWFFIRYADPDHHIRIRFFAPSIDSRSKIDELIFKAFQNSVFNHESIKIQKDTYVREIERYGESTMELSENLFHADSETILEILQWLKQTDQASDKWLALLVLIEEFVCVAFTDQLAQKYFLEQISDRYNVEFGFTNKGMIQLDQKFRSTRNKTDDYFANYRTKFPELHQLFEKRKQKLFEVMNRVKTMVESSVSQNFYTELVSSYIHMFVNRFMSGDQRRTEAIAYNMLLKRKTSQIARECGHISREKEKSSN